MLPEQPAAGSFPPGLAQSAALARQTAEGFNELATDQRRSVLRIAFDVAREPMFALLAAAGGIYLAMGDAHEAAILVGFVVIIVTVAIVQEQRTERTLAALRDLSSPRALVIRDGMPRRIPGREVVRDDVVMLAEGDRVPADGILTEAHELAIDESMLTGESVTVAKFAAGEPASPSMAYAGTLVVRGQALMRVTAIAGRTELGRIGRSLHDIVGETSPLQREVAALTRRLAAIGIGLCLLTAGLYLALRGGWQDSLLAGIALAMGILPQEFPVIMIVFLALGARRIARQQVLTRRLDAIETLGETTVLCVDKTGTLTCNRMALAALAVDGGVLDIASLGDGDGLPEPYHELLEYAVLASEIEPRDPMEQAFHRFARDTLADTGHLHPDWRLAREYELSAGLQAMSHLWRPGDEGHTVVAAKGAPEAITDLCHLSPAASARVAADAESLAARGLRVLGVAKAVHRGGEWPDRQHDFAFDFVGLIGLADPLRPDVPPAVAECRRAGIRVVMITGDHPRTARAVAAAAGIDHDQVLTGADLAATGEDELIRRVREVGIFARVTPAQKLAIVEALKAAGEVVAMTGDGVNDAPALKAAHIGIAMGRRGTDVAREAAALVLLEDDFAAIVSAVRLGRTVFANLRQALIYTVAVHVPIVGLSILPLLFGWPLVLAPVHIAFLELVIDPACSIVFEAERTRAGAMDRPPRAPDEPLVSAAGLWLAIVQGLLATTLVALLYQAVLAQGHPAEAARAIAFIALVTANSVLVLSSRNPSPSLGGAVAGLPRVGLLVLAATLAGLLAVTAIPAAAEAFRFAPPDPWHWLAAFACGLACLIPFELAKRMFVSGRTRPGSAQYY